MLLLLPVFLKKILIIFQCSKHLHFRAIKLSTTLYLPVKPVRFYRMRRAFWWHRFPQTESSGYSEPFCYENNQRAPRKPAFGLKRLCCFRKSFPPISLLCLYTCRNSDKHGEAFSVHCIAGKPTWKAVLGNRAPFGYCVLFWNVFLLDLAW